MCDTRGKNSYQGSRGWLAMPAARSVQPIGDWVDLTCPLSPDVPRVGSFPPPIDGSDGSRSLVIARPIA